MKHRINENNGVFIASFEGDIDLEHSGKARSIFLDCISRGKGVVIDMSGVTMIDSSGVASLLEAFQKARKKGKAFVLADVAETVMRVFKLARLEKVFVIRDSVDEGVEIAS